MNSSLLNHYNTTPAARLVDELPPAGEDGLRRSLSRVSKQSATLDKELRALERRRASVERTQRRLEARLAALREEQESLAQRQQEAAQRREQIRRKQRELSVSLTTTELGVPVAAQASERRVHPRCLAEIEVGVQTTHNFYAGITQDISRGGLFVATQDLLPLGQEVELSVSLERGSTINVRGEVCWLREPAACNDGIFPGMGLRFLDLGVDDQEKIQAFLRERDPLLFEAEAA